MKIATSKYEQMAIQNMAEYCITAGAVEIFDPKMLFAPFEQIMESDSLRKENDLIY